MKATRQQRLGRQSFALSAERPLQKSNGNKRFAAHNARIGTGTRKKTDIEKAIITTIT